MGTLVLAKPEEAKSCLEILKMGKAFQNAQGFEQWTNCYPNLQTIEQDIQDQTGYVLKVDKQIAGYMSISFQEEPAYAIIQGKWNTSSPYAVIHRLGLSDAFRGLGLGSYIFSLIEDLCLKNGIYTIRIDTHQANLPMQHVLAKQGFSKCGIIWIHGGERLAFDKKLKKEPTLLLK